MPEWSMWLIVAGMGLITFTQRLSLIALLDRWTLPPLLRRALRFVPVTVLPALILPELLIRDGAWVPPAQNVRLWAGLLAALVAWRTRNVLATIAVGMLTLWLVEWLLR